ncbi:MAG: RelA/SpoT family protein [Bacillota bacterium]|jgi:guanosine-3',5'-bis(diphosphate) 3'-pyrophosphohydrolase
MANIEQIIKKVKAYNSASDTDSILRAYLLAMEAHKGQTRDSGEQYIIHPLAIADILADLQLDDTSIIAGLLHDVVEDTDVELEQIRKEFGDEVVVLVDGVTKLSKLEHLSRQENHDENLRKMFLAMANDIRIILIKLADRLHNMRTLHSHHSALRQKEIAEETRTIFAPLAHRLGMFEIKSELEDLSLAILEPEKYAELQEKMALQQAERGKYIEDTCAVIKKNLDKVGIKADISGRAKNYYGIYNKMNKQQKDISEIFDLTAIRVIVDNVNDCYGVLGVIHTLWKPIPGRFKDYIAMPKQNMYQSIHTTVIGDNGDPFEVQIRTWEMHRTAEYGIAAHWRYKEGKSGDADFEKKIEWLRQMLEWQNEMRDAKEFVESVKVDLFTDNIYVFTPKGAVYELPAGSGPIDFAYRVHTQVGHQCMGAKVNRRLVPLDHKLKNGDIVEILTTKGRGPSRDWLKLVKTQQAKNKIRQWFRKEKREENILLGKELLEKECKRYGYDPADILKPDKILEAGKKSNYSNIDDVYSAIGDGALQVMTILTRIKEDFRKDRDQYKPAIKDFTEDPVGKEGIWVKGATNIAVRLAHCCKPLPGDEIIGYVTKGRGVSVHRVDCANITYYRNTEPDRLIEVNWGGKPNGVYQVEIEAIAMDRERLAIDIMAVMADTKTVINGIHVNVDKKSRIATFDLKIEVKTLEHLEYIIKRVQRVKDVIEVKRVLSQSRKY